MIDEAIIAYVVNNEGAMAAMQKSGVSADDFIDEYRSVWRYLVRTKQEHGAVPSASVLKTRFPDLDVPRVRDSDVPMLLQQLRQRRKHKDLLDVMHKAAGQITDYESVDGVIQNLQGDLNSMSMRYNGRNHMVDLFNPRTTRRLIRNIKQNRAEALEGEFIQTGLESFDNLANGGLRRQKMVVMMGRTGMGKSWLNLLFAAQAVIQGKSVVLYPLEMTLFDTAMRLYTIFTQQMYGPRKALKNLDLLSGNINTRRVARLLAALEDRFAGSLHVADMGSLADPYTVERIEAEVELLRPDMFWVDYITLLKVPSARNGDDWAAVRMLSNGIKGIAMRRNVVGGCSAQVNREALRGQGLQNRNNKLFLPRLEHISYGDSIGQDADLVFSINRNEQGLWYSLVKNRGGPEIGRRLVTWQPNDGVFREVPRGEDDDESQE